MLQSRELVTAWLTGSPDVRLILSVLFPVSRFPVFPQQAEDLDIDQAAPAHFMLPQQAFQPEAQFFEQGTGRGIGRFHKSLDPVDV